ncbi:MAG: polyprenyl synthetase family protein [Chitinispirillaceae bacterium]|jgi:geranylgeranyl diphosphate synthase type I
MRREHHYFLGAAEVTDFAILQGRGLLQPRQGAILGKIQERVGKALKEIVNECDLDHGIRLHSPLLFDWLREFVLRNGKSIRSSLFIIAYSGFAERVVPHLYRSAAALELAHDFVLIHDDIIDRADTRRGAPALHCRINEYIRRLSIASPVRGEDLSIVMGDILYALAMREFLSIKAEPRRTMRALRIFLDTGFLTGHGQFAELMSGFRSIADITKAEIYRTYDLKTAGYTFAGPLAAGALLGGASPARADKLFRAGMQLGRAFQIRNDLLDIYQGNNLQKKSDFKDVTGARRTILLWHAYHHGRKAERLFLDRLLSASELGERDFTRFAEILTQSGSRQFAEAEIGRLAENAFSDGALHFMKRDFADLLMGYSHDLLLGDAVTA